MNEMSEQNNIKWFLIRLHDEGVLPEKWNEEQLDTLARALDNYVRHASAREWVSVEDRLPEVGQECAVNIHNGDRYYRRWGIYGGDGCWSGDGGFQMCMQYPDRIQNVTHWMPLPQLLTTTT